MTTLRLAGFSALAGLALSVAAGSPAGATTKGLNQIITPDTQPEGVLSISFQGEHPAIGNSKQLQFEVGLTRKLEVALSRGLSPGQFIGGVEYGLVQRPHLLFSTGLYAPGPGQGFQPFLEAGWVSGRDYLIAGVIRQGYQLSSLLGWAHAVNRQLQVAVDYQAGSDNFATAGLIYNFTPTLQLNPAIYVSNSSPHHTYGYAVLSWNVRAW